MTEWLQWTIVAILVVFSAAYLIRKAVKASKNPCAGCDLASKCRKQDLKKDCSREKI